MRLERTVKHSRTGERLKIAVVDAEEQARRIHAAIARRAFEIFESGGVGSKEQENWRQAESELLRPLCIGRMNLDDTLWVSTDASPFEEGTINIWVAPRRLAIWGKPHVKSLAAALAPGNSHATEETMFRVVNLPVEVDPSRVTAKVNGQFLEIVLSKAQAATDRRLTAAAA